VRRLTLPPRADWQGKAEELGFVWHSETATYWDESAAYAFTLAEVDDHLEPAAEELHQMCLALVDDVVGDEALLARLAIPREHWDLVAGSWRAREPSLYGRFDFGYDGASPPKLYEYNADTPTSVFEAAVFQWLWLEDMLASGALPAGTDQFNTLFEDLRNRFAAIFPNGGFLHFASEAEALEDRQTVRCASSKTLRSRPASRPPSWPCATSGWTRTAASSTLSASSFRPPSSSIRGST
jgi:glutathionylspermidine synthase